MERALLSRASVLVLMMQEAGAAGAGAMPALGGGTASASVGETIPMLLIIAGLVALAVAARWLMVQRARVGAGELGRRSAGRAPARLEGDAGTDHRVDEVARDAEELAQRLAAQLDAKAARLEALLERAESVLARLERVDTRGAGPGFAAEPKPVKRASAAGADAVTRRVYELADAGKTPIEIARALGQQTGQVELILALRP